MLRLYLAKQCITKKEKRGIQETGHPINLNFVKTLFPDTVTFKGNKCMVRESKHF